MEQPCLGRATPTHGGNHELMRYLPSGQNGHFKHKKCGAGAQSALNHKAKTFIERDQKMTYFNVKPQKLLAAIAASVLLPFAAQAQEACSAYSVKSGDSLGSIAKAAYDTFDYQQIFNANRNLISNPNSIAVGTVLQLPCADGNIAGAESAAEIIAKQEALQQGRASTSNSFEPPMRIVSGNGWAPFTGEQLNGGGMLVRLLTTSLNRGGNNRDFNVSFVDDWASHTETLLPMNAFDISVAWYMPDCSKIDLFSDAMKRRCTELDGSLPIYESVVGFFSMKGNEYENVRDAADLAGATICRPSGWFTFDLEEKGLVDPVINLVVGDTIKDCVQRMKDGSVDVVPLEIETIESTAKEMGILNDINQNAYLTNLLQLRFVTHKTNPRGRVYLAMINRGLTEMRDSGEWYAIVSDSLAEAAGL